MKSIRVSSWRVLSSAKNLHFDIPWICFFFSTLETVCCRFWVRERSQRSIQSLVERCIASCFLHSECYHPSVQHTGLFHVSSSPVPVLKLGISKDESQKPVKSWLFLYLTWECEERAPCTYPEISGLLTLSQL